jgi:cardiolipin synthase A/B
MDRLQRDIVNAKANVFLQAMTFEADDAGNRLVNLLGKSKAVDKRLLIDNYSKVMVSDKFVYSPKNIFNRTLRAEAQSTRNLAKDLLSVEIQVKWTNPLGPLFLKYIKRDHKKLVLIDNNVSYIGGINFSDHNFAWHDMMVRIEDETINEFLTSDYLSTWEGENLHLSKEFPGVTISILDGIQNQKFFDKVFEYINLAKKTILVETPYLTFPFYEKLLLARQRGVKVDIIAPKQNNKKFMEYYTQREAAKAGIYLWLQNGPMSHLKAMLIDDQKMILGSSNFDYFSYTSQQEIVAIFTDPDFIQEMKDKVFGPDYYRSDLWYGKKSNKRGRVIFWIMKLVSYTLMWLSKITK